MTDTARERPEYVRRPSSDAASPPARVIIEGVAPEIDEGRFPIKRIVGDTVDVEADVFTEGHDAVAGVLRHRPAGDVWTEAPLAPLVNDRFRGSFRVGSLGRHEYALEAWIDAYASWRHGLLRKVEAGQTVSSEILEGAQLVERAAKRAADAGAAADARWLEQQASLLRAANAAAIDVAIAAELAAAMARHPDRSNATRYGRILGIVVERERAACGAWYEFFPRSTSPEPGRHGTFRDSEQRLAYAATMGCDVAYLPPIHPIGRSHRKGRNNTPEAAPGDPGSPWAIGAEEGGHTAIHPELGTLEDFDRLVARARGLGIEIALDIAFQCAPDHPWVREHPEWFKHRPDGTVQYAENPPKRYQDIYPLDFECAEWRALWEELLRVVLFWAERGILLFRVDNPHTKPLPFWEWLIAETKARHPEAVFLSEAFTRPKVMRYLAKAGFSQSYTYFTWRNTKAEIVEYISEITSPPVSDYMRANLFANTPDIDPEFLQTGNRTSFLIRFVLAATLSPSYGIYGPPFELCVGEPLPGREEYLDSEKFEIRHWDVGSPDLRPFITRINDIRRDNEPLRRHTPVRFVPIDNDQLIAYLRTAPGDAHPVLVVVNLDPHHAQSGFVDLPIGELGFEPDRTFQVHDLIGEGRYLWRGTRNYVQLDPAASPAHIFRLRSHLRTERDFDYFF